MNTLKELVKSFLTGVLAFTLIGLVVFIPFKLCVLYPKTMQILSGIGLISFVGALIRECDKYGRQV